MKMYRQNDVKETQGPYKYYILFYDTFYVPTWTLTSPTTTFGGTKNQIWIKLVCTFATKKRGCKTDSY